MSPVQVALCWSPTYFHDALVLAPLAVGRRAWPPWVHGSPASPAGPRPYRPARPRTAYRPDPLPPSSWPSKTSLSPDQGGSPAPGRATSLAAACWAGGAHRGEPPGPAWTCEPASGDNLALPIPSMPNPSQLGPGPEDGRPRARAVAPRQAATGMRASWGSW